MVKVQVKTDKLTNEEIKEYFRVLDGLKNEMYDCLVNVLYVTGMRIGEAHAMKLRDIDWKTLEVHIPVTKKDATRDVMIDNRTADQLRSYIQHNETGIRRREREFDRRVALEKKRLDATMKEEYRDGKVFRTKAMVIRRELRAYIRKQKSPLWGVSYRQLDRIIHQIGEMADIKKSVHPHSWRYNFANMLHNNDGDIVEIQGLMGHIDIGTTRHYLVQNKRRERELHNRVFKGKYD